jgi:hypothetical protein
MKLNIFDIYIGYVSWGGGGKSRPVLIMEQSKQNVVVLNITTKYGNKSKLIKSKYFKINDWNQAGLSQQSYVDTVDAVILSRKSIDTAKLVGKLTKSDAKRLIKFLSK